MSRRSEPLVGWVVGESSAVTLRIPCADIPAGTFRRLTGVIMPGPQDGLGELTITNGTPEDGVVVLSSVEAPKVSVVAAYLRAGDAVTLKGIRDGTYWLYFKTGADWNGQEFTTAPRRQRFVDTLPFSTSSTTYTIWNVTLHRVEGGTAATEDVDESEFPPIAE